MNKLVRYSALAVFIGAGLDGAAFADSASTTGGIKVKSDDGTFDASIGGRIHFDGVLLDTDMNAFNGAGTSAALGSNSVDNTSGAYFRRVFLSLGGHLYGWEYKIEDDLMGGESGAAPSDSCKTTLSGSTYTTVCTPKPYTSAAGFQDIYIAHSVLGGDMLYFGQRKPWRAFSEIQSNNEILFMERPITSANGIFGGRDYQDGIFYKWNDPKLGLWAGASGYSLSKAGQGSTQGMGGNGRIAWAPLNKQGELLHIGFTYSTDHADNGNSLTPAYAYGGYKLNTPVTVTLAKYSGTGIYNPATNGGTGAGGNNNATANTWTGELAAIFGPAYLEAEYAHETLGQDVAGAVGSNVDAYYVQASVFLTGESKSYKAGDAVVAGNPKPIHSYGAVELKVRYEDAKNKSIADTSATTSNATKLGCTATGAPKTTTAVFIDKCEVSDISFGVNYYVNPNVRFMFDFMKGTADLGTAGKDEPNTIAGRVQVSF